MSAPKKKAPRAKKKPPEAKTHFAIGLPVFVREGAKPAGWGDEKFSGTSHWTRDDYGRTFVITGVHDDGREISTFEVDGWFWYAEDLRIAYH